MEQASEEEATVETMTKDIIVADPTAEAEEQVGDMKVKSA